jgi:hypothetical protein
MTATTLETAAHRLAHLLSGRGGSVADPSVADPSLAVLEFVDEIVLQPLRRLPPPADVWAVDGGQATVADARCVQVLITRAGRARFRAGTCVLEEEGDMRAHVLSGAQDRAVALASLGLPGVDPHTSVDVNLLRDRWEWEAVERSVEEAEPGAMVLVDGDLQPDWRIPSSVLAGVLARARRRGVLVVGVTKHSSLSRGGAPLLGQLELEAGAAMGERACWWAPLARSRASVRADVGSGADGLQVVAARLDPDARFAFRVDLPAEADAAEALGRLAALCDDAAFPGYPYPLTVADRLAACPAWVRAEAWLQLDELLEEAGIPLEVRERAFADRHRLMERA